MERGLDGTRAVRVTSVGLAALGFVHLLAPRVLLAVARGLYWLVLDVRFEPTERSPRRVRLVGICMVAVGTTIAVLRGNDSP